MLLNNPHCDDEQASKKIPHRLHLENRGGLRIIDERLVPFIQKVILKVGDTFNNLISRTKGDLTIILKEVMQCIEETDFSHLFRYTNVIQKLVGGDDDLDFEIEESDARFDQCLHEIYVIFVKKLVNRCLWSHIKRIKGPASHSLTLRKTLLINYLSTKAKHSSLQIE